MIGYDDFLSSDYDDDDESDKETNLYIKHLRKCFIAIDDNSCCEASLLPDLRIFNNPTHEAKGPNTSLSDELLRSILSKRIEADSYEYASFQGSSRQQKNYRKNSIKNAHRLQQQQQQLQQEKPKTVESKKYPWLTLDVSKDQKTNKQDLFQPNLAPSNKIDQFKSAVTESLINDSSEINHFLDYNQFEAITTDLAKTQQTIKIFLPMCDNTSNEKVSMNVTVYKKAKISDLIGLICYKYTNEKRIPNLKYKSVNDYCLKIAEENGDIESEFSPLDMNNFVSKFGFNYLALIEKVPANTRDSVQPKKIEIIIHFTDDSPDDVLAYESSDIKMQQIYDDLCKKKLQSLTIYCPLIAYRLEHIDEPGVFVDLDANLSSYRKFEFFFYRQNSTRSISISKKSESNSILISDPSKLMTETVEFNLVYLSKWSKVPFKIELSIDSFILEEIKTSHLSLTGSKKISNYYSIPAKHVCACSDLPSKAANNKSSNSQIRIIVAELNEKNSYLYKHLDFECETRTAEDIKSAIENLILYCDSSIANDYNASKIKTSSKWSRKLYNLKKAKKTSM